MRNAVRWFWPGVITLALPTLVEAQAPAVNPGGVTNAGSYSSGGVAPGSIISIFGTNLASGVAAAKAIPLPTSLGDVTSVTFNNIPAPLFFVSATQINAQLPWNVLPAGASSGAVDVVVTRSTGSSVPQSVQVAGAIPGIFTVSQNGLGQAIATDNADGALTAPAGSIAGVKPSPHPVKVGDYLILWCTGLGPVSTVIPNGANTAGKIVNTVAKPAVLIGGVQQKLIYSVLSPQFVSENQVAVQVVSGTPTGNAVPVQIQINGVSTSSHVTIAVAEGTTTTAAFNSLNLATASFNPGTLPGMPTVTFSNGTVKPSVGYQGGDLVNGKILYYPWQVLNGTGGGGISGAIKGGIPHGVFMSYNADAGFSGFTNPSNWTFFDLTTLINSPPNTATGFSCGAIIAGNDVYLIPSAVNPYPVFVTYDATKPVNSPSSYQFFPAPARGGVLGPYYGWCGGVYDGRYVYWAPSMDQKLYPGDLHHGNVIRYDTTTPFNPSTHGSGWAYFDMGSEVNPAAKGFQSAAYDGHRFIYFIPDTNHLLIRFDTQYHTPGVPDPAAFTTPAAYKAFDPTQLGSAGYPPVTGEGSVQNLAGFTGAAVVWDAQHTNEYLYFVPWANYPNGNVGAFAPTLANTTARVRIGAQSGSTWNYIDVTGTDVPATAAPNWEIFDLTNLTTNKQWAQNAWTYPAVYPSSSALAGQSEIAGFQLSWINTASPSPRVGFGADHSSYWVEHDVSHALADPSGWYVGKGAPTHRNGTMGGGYDAAHQIFYPSSPSMPLTVASGL
jgi:uncharacterized protein (TIGR03437 family)